MAHTRQETVKLHKQMWLALEKLAIKLHRKPELNWAYKEMGYDGDNGFFPSHSFCCDYVHSIYSTCTDCPIKWPDGVVNCGHSLMGEWQRCGKYDWKTAARIARKIASLPAKGCEDSPIAFNNLLMSYKQIYSLVKSVDCSGISCENCPLHTQNGCGQLIIQTQLDGVKGKKFIDSNLDGKFVGCMEDNKFHKGDLVQCICSTDIVLKGYIGTVVSECIYHRGETYVSVEWENLLDVLARQCVPINCLILLESHKNKL